MIKAALLAWLLVGTLAYADCHQVVLAGAELLCLDHGIGSFSAEDRANALSDRIHKLSRDQTFDSERLAVVDHGSYSDISAKDQILVSLRDEDVPEKSGLSRQAFAKSVRDKMAQAIARDREERSPQELTRGLMYSAGATFGLIVLLILLSYSYRWVSGFVRSGKGRFIPSLKFNNYEFLTAQRLCETILWFFKVFRSLLTLLAFYIYIPLVLSFFPETSNWAPKLFGYVMDPLSSIGHVIVDYIPKLIFLVMVGFITRYLLKVVRFVFNEIESETIHFQGFYKEWADPTYKLVRVLILAFAAVIAFPYIPGSNSPAFQGISVFLGVLVSLGSSSAISNMVAGIVLTYMRPFHIGDRVEIAGTVGDVLEKTLLVTKILTIKNVDITIPNSMILGSHIMNYSAMAAEKGLILHTTVTIGYDSPWKTVHALLLEAASKTSLVEKTPAPFVLQTELNDFYVAYQINAYTRHPAQMATILSDLHRAIQDAFNRGGVEIMSPHYTSLRDGNEVTIPQENRKADYKAPRFGIDRA